MRDVPLQPTTACISRRRFLAGIAVAALVRRSFGEESTPVAPIPVEPTATLWQRESVAWYYDAAGIRRMAAASGARDLAFMRKFGA